jgi:hypothetical protein
VATKRPRGDVPSESLAVARVDRMIPAPVWLARSSRPWTSAALRRPPSGVRVYRVVGLSRSLLDLSPSPVWPSRSSTLSLPLTITDRLAGPLQLGFHFEALVPRWVYTLLSWDSSACAPPPTFTSGVHSRVPEGPLRSVSATCPTRSAFAVSHRLDGLLHPGAAGMLHPAAGHEVRRVSVARRQARPEALLRGSRLSHDAARTLRRIPLASSRTASPRPLPSCRCPSLRDEA